MSSAWYLPGCVVQLCCASIDLALLRGSVAVRLVRRGVSIPTLGSRVSLNWESSYISVVFWSNGPPHSVSCAALHCRLVPRGVLARCGVAGSTLAGVDVSTRRLEKRQRSANKDRKGSQEKSCPASSLTVNSLFLLNGGRAIRCA